MNLCFIYWTKHQWSNIRPGSEFKDEAGVWLLKKRGILSSIGESTVTFYLDAKNLIKQCNDNNNPNFVSLMKSQLILHLIWKPQQAAFAVVTELKKGQHLEKWLTSAVMVQHFCLPQWALTPHTHSHCKVPEPFNSLHTWLNLQKAWCVKELIKIVVVMFGPKCTTNSVTVIIVITIILRVFNYWLKRNSGTTSAYYKL